jgi:uncharacterized membrane protein
MQPQAVDASRGLAWIGCGWRLFREEWATWLGITLAYLAIAVVSGLVPGLGPLLFAVVSPALFAGAMHAAETQSRGERPGVSHLFRGLQDPDRRGPLLVLGLLLLGVQVAVSVLLVVLLGGALVAGGALSPAEGLDPGVTIDPSAIGLGGAFVLLVFLTAQVVVLMAFYFAAPLVMLDGARPVEALRSSLHACLGNLLPLTVFGLAVLVLALVAVIPFGIGLLVLFPVVWAAIYCSYVDVYR